MHQSVMFSLAIDTCSIQIFILRVEHKINSFDFLHCSYERQRNELLRGFETRSSGSISTISFFLFFYFIFDLMNSFLSSTCAPLPLHAHWAASSRFIYLSKKFIKKIKILKFLWFSPPFFLPLLLIRSIDVCVCVFANSMHTFVFIKTNSYE